MSFVHRVPVKAVHILVGVGCSVAACWTLGLQTLGLRRYKKLLALYKDGKIIKAPQSLVELKEQVCFDIDLDPYLEAGLDLFMAAGQYPVHKGSTNLRTGAIIGFPANFAYNSESDIETDKIQVSGRVIDWESVSGQQLLESMVLSTDAKRFIIGRELNYCKQHHVTIYSVMQGMTGMAAYYTGAYLNAKFQLKQRLKMWARLIMYASIVCLWGFGYVMISDTYSCYRDKKADQKTGLIGYSYALGGVEYYEKSLQRNRAIRHLMGKEGETLYTVYGNRTQGVRERYVPLTVRYENMKKMVEGYQKGEVQAKPPRKRHQRDELFHHSKSMVKLPGYESVVLEEDD